MMKITCPHCRKSLKVPRRGIKTNKPRCPGCKTVFLEGDALDVIKNPRDKWAGELFGKLLLAELEALRERFLTSQPTSDSAGNIVLPLSCASQKLHANLALIKKVETSNLVGVMAAATNGDDVGEIINAARQVTLMCCDFLEWGNQLRATTWELGSLEDLLARDVLEELRQEFTEYNRLFAIAAQRGVIDSVERFAKDVIREAEYCNTLPEDSEYTRRIGLILQFDEDLLSGANDRLRRFEELIESVQSPPGGFVYILTNPSMPDLVKIGCTTRTPEDRAEEISRGTGVPSKFHVAYKQPVSNPFETERLLHAHLAEQRVNQTREFFDLSLDEAIKLVHEIYGGKEAHDELDNAVTKLNSTGNGLTLSSSHQPLTTRNIRQAAMATTVRELKDVLRSAGTRGYSRLRKDELICRLPETELGRQYFDQAVEKGRQIEFLWIAFLIILCVVLPIIVLLMEAQ